jgi:PAS domain S-box-containing protein
MSSSDFSHQLREISEHAGLLADLGEIDPAANPQVAAAAARLLAAVEELHVAEEKLQQQNDELVAAQATLETELRRYQDLFELAPDAYLVTTLEGKILEANSRACELFGAPDNYLSGKPLTVFVAPEELRQFRGILLSLHEKRRCDDWELRLCGRRGARVFDASLTVCVTQTHNREPALRWVIRDISERKRSDRQLYEQHRFLEQLIQAHERDRQLMAYEIHDGLVQVLSGAMLHLESIDHEQRALSSRAQGEFQLVLKLLRQAVQDSRRLISGLRPPILDEHGIVMAIEYLVAEHASRGLNVRFVHHVQFGRLEPLLEGNLFRIAQEALNNAQRHSQAEEVVVRLNQPDRRVHLHVCDDGTGFDPAQVPDNRFGLQGIRKRAELLGGVARIESAPGQGTRIEVDLPLLSPQ